MRRIKSPNVAQPGKNRPQARDTYREKVKKPGILCDNPECPDAANKGNQGNRKPNEHSEENALLHSFTERQS
jgi:hypothetical protein